MSSLAATQEHPAVDAVLPPPFALDPGAVEQLLETDRQKGLSTEEAWRRRGRWGGNELRPPQRPSYWRLAARQFTDPLVILLALAAGVSAAIGEGPEALAIAAVILLNAAIGFAQEAAAEHALLALNTSYETVATVVRDGVEQVVSGAEVVPGDVLVLHAGARVAADGRVVAASALETDESALTGESLPVPKASTPVRVETPLAERTSMVYAGTGVTRGAGRVVVSATGSSTELGRVEGLATGAKPPQTPLERRLGLLARQMVAVGVVITVALGGIMLLRGSSLHGAFLVGVAVAVAAVPEGLAASITGALAIGARTLARRGAIVRRLDAIETLGQTTVICTDKTGTLTEGRMRVVDVWAAPGWDEDAVLSAALLASIPGVHDLADPELAGDSVDAALLSAALARGLSPAAARDGRRLLYDVPFTAERGRMTSVWERDGAGLVYTKGAPEVVSSLAAAAPPDLESVVAEWTGAALRVLLVGAGAVDPLEAPSDDVDSELCVLGALAFADPLRPEAAPAVNSARSAGVAVTMVTGDHPLTARTIAAQLRIPPEHVVARATPEAKLRLVEELQERGDVVAVTGDGVNDAPALRRADVGVAMGRSGTQTAREAAALVLTDDNFATIVSAIAGGRRISDDIKKVIAFLLSANLGEVLLFGVCVSVGLGVPMTVIQVLLVNLLTDGLPALALAQDPASPETMATPPRPRSALFDRRAWLALALVGIAVGTAALGAFLIGRLTDTAHAQTMAFATVALAELAFAFSCRSWLRPPWALEPNRWLVAAVVASVALVAAAVYVPVLHEPLHTVSLDAVDAVTVLALALLPFAAVELTKAYLGRRA